MAGILFHVADAGSAFEDFTTFTVVDPNGDYTVDSATQISFDSMRRDANAGIYKDMGAGYATGDFEFHFYFNGTSRTGDPSQVIVFGLSEEFYLTKIDRDNANDGLDIIYRPASGVSLNDYKTPDANTKVISAGTPLERWGKIIRVGTEVSMLLYTDSERTALDSTTVINQTSAYTYRYLYAITSIELASFGSNAITGTIGELSKKSG